MDLYLAVAAGAAAADDRGIRRLAAISRAATLSHCPVGLTGCRPPLVRPSPPPCGWSMGFMAVPRTCGRSPSQRVRPALPMLMFIWSALPMVPIVARHEAGMRRISPLGSVSWAQSASRATRVARSRRCGRAARRGPAATRCCARSFPAAHFAAACNFQPTAASRGRSRLRAFLQTVRRQNVALLAINIVQQGDPSAAIGIVLNRIDRGGHAVLVAAEIDQPIAALGRRRDAGP